MQKSTHPRYQSGQSRGLSLLLLLLSSSPSLLLLLLPPSSNVTSCSGMRDAVLPKLVPVLARDMDAPRKSPSPSACWPSDETWDASVVCRESAASDSSESPPEGPWLEPWAWCPFSVAGGCWLWLIWPVLTSMALSSLSDVSDREYTSVCCCCCCCCRPKSSFFSGSISTFARFPAAVL